VEEKSLDEIRLHEGELNVMELLWSNHELAAKDISKIIKEYIGWEKNTTYTVIKRLIDKGAVVRKDPGFICKACISKQNVQKIETQALLNKVFNRSLYTFFHDYLSKEHLSNDELNELQKIVKEQIRRNMHS
jgi:BlaI family penicillinase repressor